jgi:type II secretory ATPase GspE/PulE/Tfp pilus assembly ATPase PilB-like protein
MAIEASLTGHLVLSTLHTNSAPETVTRLLDMGMDPFNFADSLLAVLAQRLGRRLCKNCKVSTPATADQIDELLDDFMHGFAGAQVHTRDEVLADWKQRFAVNGQLMHSHSPGCDTCGGQGFKGRVGLHELLSMSRDIRRLIQKGARAEEIQHQALLEGMLTLRQDGLEKVLQGLTTLEDVRAMSNN